VTTADSISACTVVVPMPAGLEPLDPLLYNDAPIEDNTYDDDYVPDYFSRNEGRLPVEPWEVCVRPYYLSPPPLRVPEGYTDTSSIDSNAPSADIPLVPTQDALVKPAPKSRGLSNVAANISSQGASSASAPAATAPAAAGPVASMEVQPDYASDYGSTPDYTSSLLQLPMDVPVSQWVPACPRVETDPGRVTFRMPSLSAGTHEFTFLAAAATPGVPPATTFLEDDLDKSLCCLAQKLCSSGPLCLGRANVSPIHCTRNLIAVASDNITVHALPGQVAIVAQVPLPCRQRMGRWTLNAKCSARAPAATSPSAPLPSALPPSTLPLGVLPPPSRCLGAAPLTAVAQARALWLPGFALASLDSLAQVVRLKRDGRHFCKQGHCNNIACHTEPDFWVRALHSCQLHLCPSKRWIQKLLVMVAWQPARSEEGCAC
jgi:hypothetical protein